MQRTGAATIQAGGTQQNALVAVEADTDLAAQAEVSAEVEISPEMSAAIDAAMVSLRASLRAEFTAKFDAEVTAIRGDVAALQMRDVAIGGGGDSVTAWLLAAIVGAALLYPMVIRPGRRWFEGCRRAAGEPLPVMRTFELRGMQRTDPGRFESTRSNKTETTTEKPRRKRRWPKPVSKAKARREQSYEQKRKAGR